ncbi:MAG: hypothetical protein KGI78_00530 [Patescibacteria group bacterium]|nr:hypothetical protein [Patescibacteria group bacterium]MDE2057324.1 hypothetical protein [Patescibacteria group bacterium]
MGLLRSPAEFSRQMRVSCSIWVRQVAEAHPGTPWESCEGAAAALERGGYASVACTDQMLAQNWLAVTDAEGHAFGVWHRRCLPGEQLLVQGDQLLASLLCINPGVPAGAPPAPPPMMPVATGGCPAVDILKINIWGHEALALPGVERTDANEQLANRFDVYNRIAHVSYDNGAQFRQAYAAGQIGRSRQPHMMQLSFIMTSQAHGGAPDILREQIVGVVPVTGLYEWRIPAAVRRVWDAERVVPVNSDVSSPPASGQTGYHELRFFNHLPENPTEGEWARNPVPDCVMNEHFIE